ncbi:hypothetical protein OB920_13710 [Halobacteria archaeon HArc-gm2]|nr:hypothetical protein [Halobacteria archaeon HArc-gm2]
MDIASRFTALPLSARAFLVVAAVLTVNQSVAVYLESAVAATFGWPLVFLTVVAFVVAALDGVRRLLT